MQLTYNVLQTNTFASNNCNFHFTFVCFITRQPSVSKSKTTRPFKARLAPENEKATIGKNILSTIISQNFLHKGHILGSMKGLSLYFRCHQRTCLTKACCKTFWRCSAHCATNTNTTTPSRKLTKLLSEQLFIIVS